MSDQIPQDSRNWAIGAHVTALIGAFTGGIATWAGPLVIWLLRREDPFANEHAREALNFNLTILLLGVAGVILGVVSFGVLLIVLIPVGIVIAVLWLVWTVQAAMAASQGARYRYPLSIRFFGA